MAVSASPKILDGITVLDCTVAMAGPFAAQRLGDIGADVIKIEPIMGEWQRHTAAGGAGKTNINASFLSLNRNKRSLAVDLKTPEGREIVQTLAKSADVFLQNYRPGVAERLGVDYDTLQSVNPKLVYVSISGYGPSGPYVGRPGQDLLLQAMSGAMYSVGRRGDFPQPGGTYLVDAATAYSAFEGALAALFYRERSGTGQLVEINMLDTIVAFQMQELSVRTVSGKAQTRTGEPHAHVYIRAPYGVFKTADDFIALAFPPLSKLARVFEEPRLAAMVDEIDGFDRRDEIHQIVTEHAARRSTSAWLELMAAEDIWAGPVYTFDQLLDDPQVKHNGSFVAYEHHVEGPLKTPGFPVRFSKTPASVDRGAPLIGEHTREVLAHVGYAQDAIAQLIKDKVVAAM